MRILLRVFCALLFIQGVLLNAQTPAPPTAPPAAPSASTFVFVPYDKSTGPKLDEKQSILIPYAEFLKLKEQTPTTAGPETKPVAAVSSVVYTGQVTQDVAVLDAQITVEVIAKEKEVVEISFPLTNLAVESVSTEGGAPASVTAIADKPGVTLRAVGPGQRILKLKVATTVAREGARRSIDFTGPRGAAASVELKVAGAVTMQEMDGAIPAVVTADGANSVIKGFAGSSDRIVMAFAPEVKGGTTAAVAAARYSTHTYSTIRISSKAVSERTSFQINVLSGKMESLTVALPAGAKVLNATGSSVKDWAAEGEQKLAVHFSDPIADKTDVTLYLQLPDAVAGKPYNVPELLLPDAVQEQGTVTIAPEGSIALWPEESAGLESTPSAASDVPPSSRAFLYVQPGWHLTISQRPVVARVRAESLLLYEVAEEEFRIKSRHLLTISDQGLFELSLHVPADYTVREVGPTEVVAGFRQEGDRLRVSFRAEQKAPLALTLRMTRARKSGETSIILRPIHIDGAEEDSGSVILAAPAAVRVTEKTNSGLRPFDPRSAQDQLKDLMTAEVAPVLGYHYAAPDFEVVAGVEAQRTLQTAETATLVSVEPAQMRVQSTIDYKVEFSAIDTFAVRLPQSAGEDVRFDGADIKEKSHAPFAPGVAGNDLYTTWTVKLQRRVLGNYRLGVSFDQPLAGLESGKPAVVEIPKVMAGNVTREQSQIGIARGENLEVRVKTVTGFEPRDTKEMPPALAGASLAFRSFDPARASLSLEIVRHELEGVLAAVIRRMHIDTVLSDQGDAVHEVIFEVQNNREQYLELKLPPSMEIWSVFVAGAPARSTKRESDGVRLIELAKSQSRDDAFRVRMILREKISKDPLGYMGSLKFQPVAPLNIPVLRFTRRLYLPWEFTYVKFGGTMQPVTAGHAPWAQRGGEDLLNQVPASIADAIPQPNLNPAVVTQDASYDGTESEIEKQARIKGSALEIPITREGLQYDFSMISGVGDIDASYWKRRTLFFVQVGVAVVLFLLLVIGTRFGKRPAIAYVTFLAAFAAASLTTGLAARLSATALAASFAAAVLVLILNAIRRMREHVKRRQSQVRILHEEFVKAKPAVITPPPEEPTRNPDDTQPPVSS